MIKILKSKLSTGRFTYWVSVSGKNNEKLSTSETFKSKESAIKNIVAQAIAFGVRKVRVRDHSVYLKGSETYIYLALRVHNGKLIRVEKTIDRVPNVRKK